MIVIADTSPLNYLAWIGQANLLGTLYGTILVPPAVLAELERIHTPQPVRDWLNSRPEWLRITPLKNPPASDLDYLGMGEREALSLSSELNADALIIDDREGRTEATRRGIAILGTLAVLGQAAECGLIDIHSTLQQLQTTTFRASPRLLALILARFA